MIAAEIQSTQKYPCVQNWIQTGSSYRIIAIQSSDPPEAINEKLAENHYSSYNYRFLQYKPSSSIEGKIYLAPGLHCRSLMNILTDYPATSTKSLRVKNKMQTFIWLTNEIPYVMAPAALIAAMLGISIFTSVIRITQQASKVMMVGVMIALTVGVVVIQSVQ